MYFGGQEDHRQNILIQRYTSHTPFAKAVIPSLYRFETDKLLGTSK